MSTTHANEVISNQIYYKELKQHAPRYTYRRVQMSNILGNVVPVSPTVGQQVQFKLPPGTVMNLAKSKIGTLVPIGIQTTNTYSQMVADCFPFGNGAVSLETGNGLQLLNLPESSRYTKIVTKYNTKLTDYLTCSKENMPRPSGKSGEFVTNQTGTGTTGDVPYLESLYYNTSVTAAVNNIPIYYELSNFKHTILSNDKDIYFGNNDIYLKYTIGGVDNWAYQTSTAGAGAGTIATLNPAIGNLQQVYLWLCVETNPVIIDNIVSQYNSSGLRILIDYPLITTTTSTTSSNQAIVIPFTPAQGKFLKRVYHSVWNSANTSTYPNLALDCENTFAKQKVLSYNSYIDSQKLQDDIVYTNASNGALYTGLGTSAVLMYNDDWKINEPFASNSAILNSDLYRKHWVHIDDFTNPDMEKENGERQNVRDGLPMERAIQYQFIANTPSTAFIHANFAIFTRDVHISPSGIQFV